MRSAVQQLHYAIQNLRKLGIKPGDSVDGKRLADFKARQQLQALKDFEAAKQSVRKELSSLPQGEQSATLEQLALLETKDLARIESAVGRLLSLVAELPDPGRSQPSLSFRLPRLHADIAAEVRADAEEIERCFAHGCYRSVVILCGRVLEVCLHRKYFEVTGIDALEKSPGIGLGNLVAKLAERQVPLDPAIMQQIHLINQARIFSVHKKQESFRPTKEQAQAVILYTMDIVRRAL